MKRITILAAACVFGGGAFAAACSSSKSGGNETTENEDGGSSSGGELSDASIVTDGATILVEAGDATYSVTLSCTSAASCADAGTGTQVCCGSFSLSTDTIAASCQAAPCGSGIYDFQLCGTSAECTGGKVCDTIPQYTSAKLCVAADAGVFPTDGGAASDASSTDAASTDAASTTEAGPVDAATGG
jgi:hypothetical protein